jgi:2-polyprenyl-3-methyl-5-hydroxy-6-metoxy-1,4-benzoquinol methylase
VARVELVVILTNLTRERFIKYSLRPCYRSAAAPDVKLTTEIKLRVHQEAIPEIDRYLANYGSYELKDKTPEYQRYLEYVGKLRKIDASMRILEVGTGTGWFPLLCKANGLRCKGLEISPQLVDFAMQVGKRNGIVPDIELGNVEDNDIGVELYDVIIASNVFEHVEHWRSGLAKIYQALKPGGVMFFESTNKFSFAKSGEFGKFPLYGWLPDFARYRLRMITHGKDIMKLGIDFNQFRHGLLRREFKKLGFRKVLDVVDLIDADRLTPIKRNVTLASRTLPPVRSLLLTFVMPATTFVCQK